MKPTFRAHDTIGASQSVIVSLRVIVRIVLNELVLHAIVVYEIDAPMISIGFRDEPLLVSSCQHAPAQCFGVVDNKADMVTSRMVAQKLTTCRILHLVD